MVEEGRRFELVEVVGTGGFGTVYRARFIGEGGFAKDVALKVLNQKLEDVDEVARRLRDEARMLGLLRHRAIVQVDRLTRLDGRWTIVMEYVEGRSLGQILEHGVVPPASAVEIVGEIAGALNTAYNQPGPTGAPLRLLHRDIKPSNIQITPHGEVKVLDFGIARAEFEAREAETHSLAFGTLEYMSPERLDMQGEGPHADIYALGVLLFEMLVGSNFGRTSARKDRHETRIGDAMARVVALEGLSDELIGLLHAMLAWAPEDRPTAAEIERRCVRLRGGLAGEPLRFWTERALVPLLAQPKVGAEPKGPVDDELVGTILMERSQPRGVGEGVTRWERSTPSAAPERRPTPSSFPPAAVTRETPLPGPEQAQETRTPSTASYAVEPGGYDELTEPPVQPGGRRLLMVAAGAMVAIGLCGVAMLVPDDVAAPAEPARAVAESEAVPEVRGPSPAAAVAAVSASDLTPAEEAAPAVEPAPTTPKASGPEAGSRSNDRSTSASASRSRKAQGSCAPSAAEAVRVSVMGTAGEIALKSDSGCLYSIANNGSADVPPGTYAVQLRESPWTAWSYANPLTVSSGDHVRGVALQCHLGQLRCKRGTP